MFRFLLYVCVFLVVANYLGELSTEWFYAKESESYRGQWLSYLINGY